MSRVRPEQIQAIKDRIDFLALVQRYISLHQAGERWMGVCPFHQESKPSLSIHPERGLYYCFGCLASGDLIEFYRRMHGLEFMEAVQELAKEAGVALDSGPADQGQGQLRRQCLDMHALAQSAYRQALAGRGGEAARHYLHQRGLDQEVVDRFGLGWSPQAWQYMKDSLTRQGYTPEQGVQAGLLSQNQNGRIYDRFRSRIMFPIRNLSGKVVAYGGRIVGEGEPKYLNSSESPIFTKGEHLYGLVEARRNVTQTKQALLTEGYADVLSLVQHGFSNACGVLGTSLTSTQVRRLAGLCSQVSLVFDGDRAGRQAAQRSAEMLLRAGLQVRVVNLPDGEDVDSLLRTHGAEALRERMQAAEEGLAFCVNMISTNAAPKDIMTWAVNFLRSLDQVSWQAYYLPRLAEGLHVSESELRSALHSSQLSSRPRKRSPSPISSQGSGQRDRELLAFAVRHSGYLPALQTQGLARLLRTTRGQRFWEKLVQHGPEQVLPHLDDGEKAFFVASQFEEEDEATAQAVWADICALLKQGQDNSSKQSLKAALAKAQAEGDRQEVARLLSEYDQFLKGGE